MRTDSIIRGNRANLTRSVSNLVMKGMGLARVFRPDVNIRIPRLFDESVVMEFELEIGYVEWSASCSAATRCTLRSDQHCLTTGPIGGCVSEPGAVIMR